MIRPLSAGTLGFLLSASAMAQTGSVSSAPAEQLGAPRAAQLLNKQDRTFIHEAAIGGMAEVDAGKLAEQKAQNADVKKFGQRMVQDHSKANMQLTALAKQADVTAPTTLDRTHQATRAKLEKLSGADFERAYVPVQVSDHEKTIQLFKEEAASDSDQNLRSFASETLPTLQHHLEMAQNLAKQLQAEMPQASGAGTPQPQSGSSAAPQASSGSGNSQ